MMTFPLLLDAMMPMALYDSLRTLGYEVIHALSLPPEIWRNDERLLEYAIYAGLVLFTSNYADPEDNFVAIDARWRVEGREHAGSILCPQRRIDHSLWEVRNRLIALLRTRTSEDMRNVLLWLP